jgi:chromosome segregation ATPase
MNNAELNRFVTRLDTRMAAVEKAIEAADRKSSGLEALVDDIRRALAIAERDIDELRRRRDEDRKEREERWRRIWGLRPDDPRRRPRRDHHGRRALLHRSALVRRFAT